MNTTCEKIRDELPALAAGRPSGARDEVEAHLAHCPGCREEYEVLALLAEAPPVVPSGLEAGIRAAVAREGGRIPGTADPGSGNGEAGVRLPGRRPSRRYFGPAWGLAAAAVMALLLGRTLVDTGEGPGDEALAGGGEFPVLLADDGMVAGGPVLDGLSEEDLRVLLEELDG